MKRYCLPLFSLAILTGCGGGAMQQMATPSNSKSFKGVTVTSPTDNSTVPPKVHYVATATTSCAPGVSSMGIYTAPGKLTYTVKSDHLDTTVTLNDGTHDTTVQAWDQCGGSTSVPITVKVASSTGGSGSNPSANPTSPPPPPAPASPAPAPAQSKSFSNLHQKKGWVGYALLPPKYPICPNCKAGGPEMTWSMKQGVKSPSLSGNATQMTIGGKTTYGDVLWNNHLIGDFSSQNLHDADESLNSSIHNFIYDVYFYLNDVSISQALEFDINQFVNGTGHIWGHECRIAGGHEWDIWDNQAAKWKATGVACNPQSGAWNHLVIQVQRTSDNQLLFKSITLNGKTSVLDVYEKPTSRNWSGITVNYQQDLNVHRDPYSVWLDKFNFIYW